jgi:hypothetical protein
MKTGGDCEVCSSGAASPQHPLVRYGKILGSIGVLEDPVKPIPVGMANCTGWGAAGLAIWRLTVDDADVPGRWIIIDRRFVPAEGEGV